MKSEKPIQENNMLDDIDILNNSCCTHNCSHIYIYIYSQSILVFNNSLCCIYTEEVYVCSVCLSESL